MVDDPYATGILWYEYSNTRQVEIFDPIMEKLDLSREMVYLKE